MHVPTKHMENMVGHPGLSREHYNQLFVHESIIRIGV